MVDTVLAPDVPELSRLWYRFQELAEFRVMEGNALAGERVWETVKSPGLGTLTIRSTRVPVECVECAVDPGTFLLTCRFGARPPAALEFPLANFTAGALDKALSQILDCLIWEDCAGQAAAGSEL